MAIKSHPNAGFSPNGRLLYMPSHIPPKRTKNLNKGNKHENIKANVLFILSGPVENFIRI